MLCEIVFILVLMRWQLYRIQESSDPLIMKLSKLICQQIIIRAGITAILCVSTLIAHMIGFIIFYFFGLFIYIFCLIWMILAQWKLERDYPQLDWKAGIFK